MKYNKRRGAKETQLAATPASAPVPEEEVDDKWKKKYQRLKRQHEKAQLEQMVQQ